jgi:hypothetical protein
MDYVTKFNSTFNEFLDEMITVFPDDVDFRMYKLAMNAGLSMNNKLIINVFNQSVVTIYGDQILAKDEEFFLNNKYEDIADNPEYNALINKIKNYWTILSEDNKTAIWKYFRVLILLSKKIAI